MCVCVWAPYCLLQIMYHHSTHSRYLATCFLVPLLLLLLHLLNLQCWARGEARREFRPEGGGGGGDHVVALSQLRAVKKNQVWQRCPPPLLLPNQTPENRATFIRGSHSLKCATPKNRLPPPTRPLLVGGVTMCHIYKLIYRIHIYEYAPIKGRRILLALSLNLFTLFWVDARILLHFCTEW